MAESVSSNGLPVTQADGTILESATADSGTFKTLYRWTHTREWLQEYLESRDLTEQEFIDAISQEQIEMRCRLAAVPVMLEYGVTITEKTLYSDGSVLGSWTLNSCLGESTYSVHVGE